MKDNKIGEYMKIITICGSLKFQNEMMVVAQKLALKGYCVRTPVYQVLEKKELLDEQIQMLKDAHFKKIEMSDAIFVVNVNNYIGYSTNLEIEYAKSLGKEIIYFTDDMENN